MFKLLRDPTEQTLLTLIVRIKIIPLYIKPSVNRRHISFINNYISTGDSYVKVELMSPEGVGYECSLEPVNLVRNSTEYSVRRAIEGAARGISRLKEMPWDCYG